MQAARDRQNSYADKRRRPIEFEVGDKILLKVSPWKATTKTTTATLPPPLQQQSSTDPELENYVSALEKVCANFEKKHKIQDQTIQAISCRVFTLENHDLYSKIDKQINEVVKEAVYDALQALILDRFRELFEVQMNEILHDRREEFLETTAKSQKRCRDDQVPPPPPLKDSDQSKKKRHDFDASALKHPPAQTRKQVILKDCRYGFLIKWYCKQIGKKKLSKANLEGPALKIDLMNPKGILVVHDVSKPLPLGGPLGQVTIQAHCYFNKDLEYLVSGDKERRHALLISKMKAAYYPDFGLEELVPSLWIESERVYDISSSDGITHWWFKCKEFYLTRHSAPFDRHAEIVLRRADYKEHKILEADFKNMHLNDFEYLYLLHLQGKLNHLSGADKVHLFNAMMRETEVHKFSDGTLQRILEKLDFMGKDYKESGKPFSGRLRDVDYRLITSTE
nr:oxoglutarate/iron-dependent dioxygenase [Tanacetum cinerariifolium]